MIGSVLVQAVGAPITAPGFVMDAFAQANVLALEVPGSGLGNESPSFSAIATGLIGPGTWGFNLCLSLPNSVSPSVIASATGTNNTSGSLPYTVEADVTVTNGIPSGTWNLFINNVSVASGNLSNFPLVPYPTRPANGATITTTKIRRPLVLSCNVTQVESGYQLVNPIFRDSFRRANENPLNPTNWTTLTGLSDLQILNNECEPSGGSSAVGAAFCTTSFPSDQWAEIKINHLTSSNNAAGLFVRTTPNFNSTYYLKVIGPANGTARARIQLRVAVS